MYSDFFQDEDLEASLSSFEDALQRQEAKYFEVHELEFIVDYYFSTNNIEKADKALQTAFQIHPYNYELKKRQAQLYNLKAEYSSAYQEIEEAVAAYGSSEDVDYYMILGEASLGLDNEKDARKAFKKALDLSEDDYVDIASSIASVYQLNQKHKEAIYYLEIAVQRDAMLFFDLALSYHNILEYDRAIVCCKKYLKLDSFSFDAWFLMYNLYVEKDNYILAEDAILNTIAIVPNLLLYKQELASFYTENEQYLKALDVYKEIMQESKDVDIDVLLAIGDICLLIDLPQMALKNFQNILRLSPEHPKALYGMARIEAQKEDYVAADLLIHKALKEDSNNPDYLLLLADILSLSDRVEDAEIVYKNLLKVHANFEEAWEHYIDFYFYNKDYLKTIAMSLEAIKNGIDKEVVEYKMVAAYSEMKEYSLAINLLGEIFKNDKRILDDFKEYYPQWSEIVLLKKYINNKELE